MIKLLLLVTINCIIMRIRINTSQAIKPLIFYLIFLSIILEIFHLIIPERSFQWADLLGNLLGVVIVIFINSFINIYEISSK